MSKTNAGPDFFGTPNALHVSDNGLHKSDCTYASGFEHESKQSKLFDNSIGMKQPKYVTDVELARQLNLSVNTIRKWRCQGKIVPYEFGRSVRYVADEVVAALTRKGRKIREVKKR